MSIKAQMLKGWVRLTAAAVVTVSLMIPAVPASAAARDNDANAIMWGGCYTKSECLSKINHGDGHHSSANLKQIYYGEGRGMTESNFNSTVDGEVTKDGRVIVNGQTVATGAMSIGRANMPGSQRIGSVYMRPTSVSFQSASIPAFIYMEGGVFRYAVIKSCGNYVYAKPKPKPTPPPTPAPGQFSCVQLVPTQPDKTGRPALYRFTVTPHVSGNVKLTGYRFLFSDNSAVQDTAVNMPYVEREISSGNLTVYGEVKTTAGITQVSQVCSATVNIASPVPTPPGQVLGVTAMPVTGPETALGGIAGLSAIGVASRYYLRSRKSLAEAMRRKK